MKPDLATANHLVSLAASIAGIVGVGLTFYSVRQARRGAAARKRSIEVVHLASAERAKLLVGEIYGTISARANMLVDLLSCEDQAYAAQITATAKSLCRDKTARHLRMAIVGYDLSTLSKKGSEVVVDAALTLAMLFASFESASRGDHTASNGGSIDANLTRLLQFRSELGDLTFDTEETRSSKR